MNRHSSNRGAEWKTLRFTRQVQESLAIALAACGDPVLSVLAVDSVVPAPDAGHLLVTVSFAVDPIPDPLKALERLHAATGWLREEIAPTISRKRVPELAFRFAPLEDGGT
jgi:ribosome-binding factor A